MQLCYDKSDVRLLYPENWELVESASNEWPKSITLTSPNGGYWELRVYPDGTSLEQLTTEAVEAMREIYGDVEPVAITETLENLTAKGYDLHFFCLDLLVVCRIRAFQWSGRSCLLIFQAESREFDKQIPVFLAMTKSLLSP